MVFDGCRDGRSQTLVETERERWFRGLLWGSDTARLRPEKSVVLRHFGYRVAALFHKGEKVHFLFQGYLVLCDVAGILSAIVVTIAFDHPSCTNFHL